MSEKMPRLTADEIIRTLRKAGFVKVDQSGSHQKWHNYETGKITIVAYHRHKIIPPKIFKRIPNQINPVYKKSKV